jgi:hypothetical protein
LKHDQIYIIFTQGIDQYSFKQNPTLKLAIPLGAKGCRAITNYHDTNIIHIKNVFDYDGFKELNHTVFDMKEIC